VLLQQDPDGISVGELRRLRAASAFLPNASLTPAIALAAV